MAVQTHNANPIIVEPAASSNLETSPRHLTPPLYNSSSNNSFDSSRPQSRGSSATTPSEASSPIPRSIYSHELPAIRPPTPLNLEPPTPDTTTSTTPLPSELAESSTISNENPGRSLWRLDFTRRRWLKLGQGVVALVASLAGLLFVGVRTYKLAVISAENSTLDGCTGLIQVSEFKYSFGLILTNNEAGFATIENSTQLCKTAMTKGPLSSPYHLGRRRTLHASLGLASRWINGPSSQTCGFPDLGCQFQETKTTYRNMSALAIIISTTFALGWLVLKVARRNARPAEVFASPALSNIQITQHDDSGPKTITGQGVIERHKSEDCQDLNQLRKRIRTSQDQESLLKDTSALQWTNSSSTTLADGYNSPQVSIEDCTSGKKDKGLVEMQMNGHTKGFWKLETSEFLHLNHWKDQSNEDSDSSSDSDNPLSVEKNTFPQTDYDVYASALAKGKALKHKCIVHAAHQARDLVVSDK